jgi:hypothetical protein
MRPTNLGILHLTDLHAGQPSHDDNYPHMREGFFGDLAKCHQQCGPWDLVVFSGDLTYKGSEPEFGIVDRFLEELHRHLQKLGSNDPLLLAVPGNHDLSRPADPANGAVLSLTSMSHLPAQQVQQIWDVIIKKPDSDIRKKLESIFGNYSKWWSQRISSASGKFISYAPGALPGDFALTFERNSSRFAIVGLNSTFMQLNDTDFHGKLQVHVQQMNRLFPDLDILKEVDAALLITHQPPDWLDKNNREQVFEPLIAKAGRFAAHLCGHMHLPKNEASSQGASIMRRLFLGRSLLAKEPTLDKLDRVLGYQALQIQIDPNSQYGVVRCWPRTVISSQSRDWVFVPDHSFNLEHDGGTPKGPETSFPRPNWKASAGRPSSTQKAPRSARNRREAERLHPTKMLPMDASAMDASDQEPSFGRRGAPLSAQLPVALPEVEPVHPILTETRWHPAIVFELEDRLRSEPSIRALEISHMDSAILDHNGHFTGNYRTKSITLFHLMRPTHLLQFDFQIGNQGSFDRTHLTCTLVDSHFMPLQFDYHVQEMTKSQALRSFRLYFLFSRRLASDSPNQPFRVEYRYDCGDSYPNLGAGPEVSSVTMRQGGAHLAMLCVAFPRSKIRHKKPVDLAKATSVQLKDAKYVVEDELLAPSEEVLPVHFADLMDLGKHTKDRYYLVGRRIVDVKQGQAFGFLIE